MAIIKDKNELLQRVNEAAKRENIDFLCGDVHYRGLKLEGNDTDVSTRHHIVIKCDALFDMADFNLKSKRDCFVKVDRYAWQKEWRIASYRGIKDTDAYRLEIGDIRDIVECVPAGGLASTVDRLFRFGVIKTYDDVYYGNISRQDLKEKFISLAITRLRCFVLLGKVVNNTSVIGRGISICQSYQCSS